jgi:hypothetical protein
MGKICGILVIVFAGLYLGALVAFAAGTCGLFGSPQGPLAGVFLVPLGMPWNWFVDAFPQVAWPVLAALAPAINLILLVAGCRRLRRRSAS